ncbi:MAG TPA: DUF2283 domain-containing protein [Vicinamibacteria bacterium]|nr:DUF2283 domain-containing protein [Vicinamibacteria bacterium]
MSEATIHYDESSDSLYVSFAPGEPATGFELSEHILLRINKSEQCAVGLTFLEYSTLTEKTALGPRSFPLTGLARLSSESRELILSILQRPPVSDFLTLSAYTPSRGETIPTASIRVSSLVVPTSS